MQKVGRPSKPVKERAKNAGVSAYPKEISAIKAASADRRFKTLSDYIRSLVIDENHPLTRGKIVEPRRI